MFYLSAAETLTEGLQRLAEMMVALLTHTYCRILLADESESFLIVHAAYALPRPGQKLQWDAGLEQHITISDWTGLSELLEEGTPRVLRWNDEQMQPYLRRHSHLLSLEQDVQSLLVVPYG